MNGGYQQTVRYGEDVIHYFVRPAARRHKQVRIHVNPNGTVEVEAPENADAQAVREAIRARGQWIVSHLREISEQNIHVLPREYVSGESHFYLGRRYVLKVVPLASHMQRCEAGRSGDKASEVQGVKLSGAYLIVRVHPIKTFRLGERQKGRVLETPLAENELKAVQSAERQKVKILLREWYREHAEAYFNRRLSILKEGIPWLEHIPSCRLQVMQRQWGSCSPTGTLLLNPHLVKAPARCIEYVLLHEICHLREHNHSKAFYALLDKLLPDWRKIKDKLDGMAELLLNE